jgi:hypothetical protein
MLFPAFILLFLFQLSLISSSEFPKGSIFEGINLEPEFISKLEDFTLSTPPDFFDVRFNPVVFGNETIGSIFYKLATLSQLIPFNPNNSDAIAELDGLVERNYKPLVKALGRRSMKDLLNLSKSCSLYHFHIFVINVLTDKDMPPFTGLIASSRLVKGSKKYYYAELGYVKDFLLDHSSSFFSSPSSFVEMYVEPLFKNELLLACEWGKRKELVNLCLDLVSKTDFIFDYAQKLSIEFSSADVSRYKLLLENSAIVDGDVIDIEKF